MKTSNYHYRLLTKEEFLFLKILLRLAFPTVTNIEADMAEIKVADMPGGMGSLLFYNDRDHRKLGSVAIQVWFKDSDGVDVNASINIDEQGELFELDIWKVDYSTLLRFPEKDELEVVEEQ